MSEQQCRPPVNAVTIASGSPSPSRSRSCTSSEPWSTQPSHTTSGIARSNATVPARVIVSVSPCSRALTAPEVTVSSTGGPAASASAATMLAITMAVIVPGQTRRGNRGATLELGGAAVDDQLEGVGHVPLERVHHGVAAGVVVDLVDVQQ